MAGRKKRYDAVVRAPVGRLGIETVRGCLAGIDFLGNDVALRRPASALVCRVRDELQAYFADPAIRFDLPLALAGTPFQMRVWRALRRIPPGTVLSYGQLAHRLGTSARAVGGACRANPVPIVIPCHRVVAKSGIGGFMGEGSGRAVDLKRWLLRHERR